MELSDCQSSGVTIDHSIAKADLGLLHAVDSKRLQGQLPVGAHVGELAATVYRVCDCRGHRYSGGVVKRVFGEGPGGI